MGNPSRKGEQGPESCPALNSLQAGGLDPDRGFVGRCCLRMSMVKGPWEPRPVPMALKPRASSYPSVFPHVCSTCREIVGNGWRQR